MVDSVRLSQKLQDSQAFIHPFKETVAGRLVRVVGLTLEAVGVKADVGSQCMVETSHGDLIAEVVGFAQDITYLMPEQSLQGVSPGARVIPLSDKEKIMSNMSKRAAEMLDDDLEAMGPVRISEVEAAQKEILAVARRLSDAGEIMLGSAGGGDEFL